MILFYVTNMEHLVYSRMQILHSGNAALMKPAGIFCILARNTSLHSGMKEFFACWPDGRNFTQAWQQIFHPGLQKFFAFWRARMQLLHTRMMQILHLL
jgi:hypothetical protein